VELHFGNGILTPSDSVCQSPRLIGVERGLAALKEMARHPTGVSLEELAQRLGTPKSSLHRSLASLRRAGLVQQDERRLYRLSLDFVSLAFDYYDALEEPLLVQPALKSLASHLAETAHYAVLDGGEVVYVAKVTPSGQGFQMASTVGGRSPAHSTALGKAMLAYELRDDASVRRFVDEHGPLVRRTSHTIAGAAALARELAATRERGFALDREENEPGVNCIAFPLFIRSGHRPAGAISVSAAGPRKSSESLVGEAGAIRSIIETDLGQVTRERAAAAAETRGA
jgi:IclR family acetate operon transcriptional repressor